MTERAIFWIRDGVLINRMPVNAVAFALAALTFAENESLTFTSLINFAFANSGISCGDKLKRLGAAMPIANIEAASGLYNELASEAAAHCHYFPGMLNLLKKLHENGVLLFITSAVEQVLLDQWAVGAQGRQAAAFLTEILGKRAEIAKGKEHFAYARKKYGLEEIYYVADAALEIAAGADLSEDFNIKTLGFANCITGADIAEALRLIMKGETANNLSKCGRACNAALEENGLELPGRQELKELLIGAGANFVVEGESEAIVSVLDSLLFEIM